MAMNGIWIAILAHALIGVSLVWDKGSFLIFFAISRAHPAIVDAISGVRYVMIFLAAYLVSRRKPKWLQEDFRRRALIGKTLATGLIVAGLVLLGVGGW